MHPSYCSGTSSWDKRKYLSYGKDEYFCFHHGGGRRGIVSVTKIAKLVGSLHPDDFAGIPQIGLKEAECFYVYIVLFFPSLSLSRSIHESFKDLGGSQEASHIQNAVRENSTAS
jgi:hypothetical protein